MKRISAFLTALLLSLSLSVPVLAAYEGEFLYDPDGILAKLDAEALDRKANVLTDAYPCGVYIFAVEDLTDYGYDDVYELAQDYYDENLLGSGEDRDGILLTLSTETRDVSLAVYGPWAQTVFTDYTQELVWDAFLDDFGNEDWYGGITDYLSACGELLYDAPNAVSADTAPSTEHDSAPVHSAPVPQTGSVGKALLRGMVQALLPAVVIAFFICGLMKKKMKTARKASGAAHYVTGAVDLKVRTDRYTHSTTVRTPIKTDNGPGNGGPRLGGGRPGGGHHSTSVNSRGFSGGGRKF